MAALSPPAMACASPGKMEGIGATPTKSDEDDEAPRRLKEPERDVGAEGGKLDTIRP